MSNKDEKNRFSEHRQNSLHCQNKRLIVCSLQRLIVYVNFLQSMVSHFLHIINCWQTESSSGWLGNNITYLFAQNLRTPGVFAAIVSMAFCPFRQFVYYCDQWISLSLLSQTEAACHQYWNDHSDCSQHLVTFWQRKWFCRHRLFDAGIRVGKIWRSDKARTLFWIWCHNSVLVPHWYNEYLFGKEILFQTLIAWIADVLHALAMVPQILYVL